MYDDPGAPPQLPAKQEGPPPQLPAKQEGDPMYHNITAADWICVDDGLLEFWANNHISPYIRNEANILLPLSVYDRGRRHGMSRHTVDAIRAKVGLPPPSEPRITSAASLTDYLQPAFEGEIIEGEIIEDAKLLDKPSDDN